MGQRHQAELAFDRALEQDDTRVQAWFNRGLLRCQTGDLDGGLHDFKQAAEHRPGKTIAATVEVVEPIGNETYVNVAAGNVTLTAAVGRRAVIKPHSSLNLVPIFENMHLFDFRSQKSLINS